MKILSANQIREADQFTIKKEPIKSIDLMERAVSRLFESIQASFDDRCRFAIFCGKGNNGGDGLALGRWLSSAGFGVEVFIIEHSDSSSEDFTTNLKRLQSAGVTPHTVKSNNDIPSLAEDVVIMDAMLGSGLSRPLEGLLSDVVQALNTLPNEKIAIDIPTGLFADDNSDNNIEAIFKSDNTLTFQCPKLSMMHKDTAYFAGYVEVLDIGLDSDFIRTARVSEFFVTPSDIKGIYRPRKRYSYKGTYGHILAIAGSYGSMGAAIMSGTAALRSGAGLLTAYIPQCGMEVYQTSLPEAMAIVGDEEKHIAGMPDLEKYNTIAAGPGIGQHEDTIEVLKHILRNYDGNLVLDADALNIIASNRDMLKLLPEDAILTPHPGEFKRLIDKNSEGDYLEDLRSFSKDYNVVVILKNTISTIATPDGNLFFMDYGTPALAKGGSGDVLTGVVAGLLASGYRPDEAAKLGVYLQGVAAHYAEEKTSAEACMATDVIRQIGLAFQAIND